MTQIVNNTDKLTFVLTSYGHNRITEAMSDPDVDIYLSKIKLGNADYYDPSTDTDITELRAPIPNAEFYLVSKELLEDGLTVCLHAIIPEEFGNCDITEVGLYETVSGVDKLFAISTQQPFVKPSASLNYLITIDYYMFLKSQNLATIYDKIIISQETSLVTYSDLDQYLKTVLFAQASLMDQIGHNSYTIGLNRAEQLYQKIEEDRKDFGYYSLCTSYSNVLDTVSPDEIVGFWVFDYPKVSMTEAKITNLVPQGNKMTCDQGINRYSKYFSGIFPELDFTHNHYYEIENMSLLNGTGTGDSAFTMMFCVEPPKIWSIKYYNDNKLVDIPVTYSEEDNVVIKANEDTVKDSLAGTNDTVLYAWKCNPGNAPLFVYTRTLQLTRDSKLYNKDGTNYTGDNFKILASSEKTLLAKYNLSDNLDPKRVFKVEEINEVTIDSTTKKIINNIWFKITLYKDENNYIQFVSPENSALENAYTLIFTYNPAEKSILAYLNGNKIEWNTTSSDLEKKTREVGTYTYMEQESTDVSATSYITSSSGAKVNFIDKDITVVSVIKALMDEEDLKKISLIFGSGVGAAPCIGSY